MHILLIEDVHVDRLRPITLTRPAFSISCASFRLLDQLSQFGGPLAAIVQPHLRQVLGPQLCDLDTWQMSAQRSAGLVLIANARLVPSAAVVRELQLLLDARQPALVKTAGEFSAALVPAELLPLPSEYTAVEFPRALDDLNLPQVEVELPLFGYLHDVIRHHESSMMENMQQRLQIGGYTEVAEGVYSASGTALSMQVATDTRIGPIILEADVELGPFAFLQGPLFIGQGVRVHEHASIRAFTAVGHTAKIGGEIEHSIMEPFSNKFHYGFLGNSYVGSWVNLGAGTCTSNLKNTYGEVKVVRDATKRPTGMQFLGAMIGDYAKTAINTAVFAGKSIGAASFVYGTVTENVPSFVNYARSFGQVTTASVAAITAMQQRMLARRGLDLTPELQALMEAVFEITQPERAMVVTADGPPTF